MLNIELNNGNIGYFGLLIVPTEIVTRPKIRT